MADWSALPGPALVLISQYQAFPLDYIRFRSVCTTWRSAAPMRPYIPLLVSKYDIKYCSILFFTFTGFQLHLLEAEDLPSSTCSCPVSIPGCAPRWIALLDENRRSMVTLMDPFTKYHLQLPPLFNDLGGEEDAVAAFYDSTILLSSDPSVSSDFTALAICTELRRFAVWRTGNNAWTSICSDMSFDDVLFRDGKIYLACEYDIYVYSLELGLQQIPPADPPFSDCPSFSEKDDCVANIDYFLVESAGDLLLVTLISAVGNYEEALDDEMLFPEVARMFEVFKLDLRDQHVRLLKTRSLGDQALFLEPCLPTSVSVTASKYPGCRANCIYLADDRLASDGSSVCVSLYDGSDGFLSSSSDGSLSYSSGSDRPNL